MKPAIQGKTLQLLAWLSDEMKMQIQIVAVSAKTADTQSGLIERFLSAYRQGAHDFHDAFMGPGETGHDRPTAPEVYAILAKYMGQPVPIVKVGVAHP